MDRVRDERLKKRLEVNEGNEPIEFRVTNMRGDASLHMCTSIDELRLKLAVQAGVLVPCIALFTEDGDLLFKRDEHEEEFILHFLQAVFDELNELRQHQQENQQQEQPQEQGEHQQQEQQQQQEHHQHQPQHPQNEQQQKQSKVLTSVINEEALKQEVSEWTAHEWYDALRVHIKYHDENILDHAHALITHDKSFRDKMHQWAQRLICDYFSHAAPIWKRDQGEFELEVRLAIVLGLHLHTTSDDGIGCTFLDAAASQRDTGVLRMLIEAQCDVNAKVPFAGDIDDEDEGFAPLERAIFDGRLEVARALLEVGASPNVRCEQYDGATPLHHAATYGRADIGRLLIAAQAEVDARDDNLYTPLHGASAHGHVEVMRLLLGAGASRDAENMWGKPPVHFVNDEECRKLLEGE